MFSLKRNRINFFCRYYSQVKINHKLESNYEKILNKDSLKFLSELHLNFNKKRLDLLNLRYNKKGLKLGFLEETKKIREDKSWKINELPNQLKKRIVEITGPVDRKMIINALNSKADCFMADFEDSNSPLFTNQIQGQINLNDAINRVIDFEINGKKYQLNNEIATLIVRPRGLHLPEKYLILNNESMSGSLVDFGLYFYINARKLLESGSGPFFYLPKLESHLEARWWNEVFNFSQDYLSIPRGSIKSTCLIETLPAAFEMDEIIYELKEHCAGLNTGRWDYIFSCIKTFQKDPNFVLADRSLLSMNAPFLRSYALQLIKTCHQRDALAIGGMSALIPIKNDFVANEKALNGVKLDKLRDAEDGFDGGWVAHPGLVSIAREEFLKVLKTEKNQVNNKRNDVVFDEQSLINFEPQTPITENGLRTNINVSIQYLGSWLQGNGCVPINNLMEDAATAEISRSQVWNWIKSEKAVLNDNRKIDKTLVKKIIKEELEKLKKNNTKNLPFEKASKIFEDMSTKDELEDFLTLLLYENF